ncbi:hypothetical protein [Luteimonas terrae]|uniref:Zinc ribbon domain-containing protein n=1 Tax=Luteimonas terrae TaxID=1530191 RepID=A0ABU1XX73_9GAMM|nr:hypothetical protein [Luteimonas terrae]MDR7193367.1 hypothetical protein [Luteimonas terrae]
MALTQCEECGREISDRAVACPHCGVPRATATANTAPPPAPRAAARPTPPAKPAGSLWPVILVLACIAIALSQCGDSKAPDSAAPAATTPPPSQTLSDPAVEGAAIAKFTGMPGIRHAEWLDGDFLLAAVDNGKSWQPVAEAACAHLHSAGKRGRFSVVVLEAAALRNKNWKQMARARCN